MNKLQKYFRQHKALIEQFLKGDLSKSEYIDANYAMIADFNIKPFKRLDNKDKALYNYQYYNTMAKKAKMQAYSAKDALTEQVYFDELNYCYSQKDKATLKILDHLDYKNVKAYFINVHSKALKGHLFEIVLSIEDNIILHCASEAVLKKLREENVFDENIKKSLIDDYINQRY